MFITGTVVATYPEGNSVDVLLDTDGDRLSNVQVLTPSGSSNSGVIDLPHIDGPTDERRWELSIERERYVKAMVGFCRGVPFVVGFLLPQVNQITFKEPNRRIVRHASDVYSTIDDAGNIEVHHPSGTFLRIGENPAHEDLTGKDFDKRWKLARNTARQVHVRLDVRNGGSQVALLSIDPAGNVTLQAAGTITSSAPAWNHSGPVNIDGHLTVDGPVDVVGGNSLEVAAGGDVILGSITLGDHRHTEQGDGAPTSGPIAGA